MVFSFFLSCKLVLFVFVVFSIKYPHRLTNYFAFFCVFLSYYSVLHILVNKQCTFDYILFSPQEMMHIFPLHHSSILKSIRVLEIC